MFSLWESGGACIFWWQIVPQIHLIFTFSPQLLCTSSVSRHVSILNLLDCKLWEIRNIYGHWEKVREQCDKMIEQCGAVRLSNKKNMNISHKGKLVHKRLFRERNVIFKAECQPMTKCDKMIELYSSGSLQKRTWIYPKKENLFKSSGKENKNFFSRQDVSQCCLSTPINLLQLRRDWKNAPASSLVRVPDPLPPAGR